MSEDEEEAESEEASSSPVAAKTAKDSAWNPAVIRVHQQSTPTVTHPPRNERRLAEVTNQRGGSREGSESPRKRKADAGGVDNVSVGGDMVAVSAAHAQRLLTCWSTLALSVHACLCWVHVFPPAAQSTRTNVTRFILGAFHSARIHP
jgi:hypothetical protein